MTLQERLEPRRQRKLLSIDGGGIRDVNGGLTQRGNTFSGNSPNDVS